MYFFQGLNLYDLSNYCPLSVSLLSLQLYKNMNKQVITIETLIAAPIEQIWEYWTLPEHITQWYYASDDWHSPRAENDLRVGGKFLTRMEAKDGSFGFDFEGTYSLVENHKRIECILADDRTLKIDFIQEGNHCKVVEAFEAEETNPVELQQGGWQAILNNFKKHIETNS